MTVCLISGPSPEPTGIPELPLTGSSLLDTTLVRPEDGLETGAADVDG